MTSQETCILLNATVRISGFTLQNLVFRINRSKGNGKSRLPTKYQDELEQDEGLALLIPDIQETANLVQVGQSNGI
jgi:baculoviral IAP repeat-containing protein 6